MPMAHAETEKNTFSIHSSKKEEILSKRQREALLAAEQEPCLAWSQTKENCEPLISISAGCCPECLIFVPKNSMADLFTEEFSKRCLGCAQHLPLLLSLGIPGMSGWFIDFSCSLQPPASETGAAPARPGAMKQQLQQMATAPALVWHTLPKRGQAHTGAGLDRWGMPQGHLSMANKEWWSAVGK